MLIIPSGTAADAAQATLKLATQDTAGLTPDDILNLATLPSRPAARPTLRTVTAGSSAD
ncbi:hypothetical protein ACFQQB_43515 [Nonomuraea rubra]|uniref:hypothetical protein n=1 Tax=Nonomuraea rubra TaxID=46180 RepID=UPI00361442ED